MTEMKTDSTLKFGAYAALALSIVTLAAFSLAMIAIPPSGPYCPGDCMEYPYSDLLHYYPRDYYWMYLAVIQLFTLVVFSVSVHHNATEAKRLYSLISLAFVVIASTVLLITYFTQFTVVPISIMKGETEGIALITQYNGNGLFIAMEELGYITLSLAFLFLAPVFPTSPGPGIWLQWILILQFIFTAAFFVWYAVEYGIDRSYRFEVAAIGINWLTVIIVGVLSAISFRRQRSHP